MTISLEELEQAKIKAQLDLLDEITNGLYYQSAMTYNEDSHKSYMEMDKLESYLKTLYMARCFKRDEVK